MPDRISLVTGSSRGLGAATALQLARRGDNVIVTYRSNKDEGEAVAEQIRELGCKAWVTQLDLEDEASIDAAFEYARNEAGGLDVLVMNAAATSFRPLLDAERRHIERTFAISVTGFLQAVQLAVPLMEQRGGGRIVAISGADTESWIPAHGLLGAAKAAMENMVKYLGCEIAERGVTIVGVRPGWIDGDSLQMMLGPFYDVAVETEKRTHPLRSTASPDDIGEVVAMLTGDDARWLNGTTVSADGDGLFAFCGRYASVGAELAMVKQSAKEAATGDAPGGLDTDGAPSVPKM